MSGRRSSPSRKEVKKNGANFKLAQAVNKRFAALAAHWRQVQWRLGPRGKSRMSSKVRTVLLAEAKQYAEEQLSLSRKVH